MLELALSPRGPHNRGNLVGLQGVWMSFFWAGCHDAQVHGFVCVYLLAWLLGWEGEGLELLSIPLCFGILVDIMGHGMYSRS